MIPNGFLPQGCNVYLAEAIKKEMKHTPVVTVGALGDPELMESIIAEGRADIVALARPLLADPELPNKLKAGRDDLGIPMPALHGLHKRVLCALCAPLLTHTPLPGKPHSI